MVNENQVGTYLVGNGRIVENTGRAITMMSLFSHVQCFAGIIELPAKWPSSVGIEQ